MTEKSKQTDKPLEQAEPIEQAEPLDRDAVVQALAASQDGSRTLSQTTFTRDSVTIPLFNPGGEFTSYFDYAITRAVFDASAANPAINGPDADPEFLRELGNYLDYMKSQIVSAVYALQLFRDNLDAESH